MKNTIVDFIMKIGFNENLVNAKANADLECKDHCRDN